jgi:Xaa-Pro aminopeptidase
MISDATRILLRTGIRAELDELVVSALQRRDRARQHFGTGPITIEDPTARIAELRLRKSSAEIDQMRFASDVSSVAHVAAMRNTKPGRMEYQLQATIEGFFVYAGTSGWAYPSIVGCGDNATVLHYHQNNDVCEDGEVILIDAGAEYRGYAADITRSWPISGTFTEAQREIYQIVLDAQLAAIDKCRPGLAYNAPHEEARRVLAEGLIELGVITQTLDEALNPDTGELKKWYMHNTGHWIGLDVHDVGIYKPNGEPRLLEEGMVLTVEPGLYFGAWRPDVDCPQRYANLGIRIEDDVLVTSGDPDVLTASCPKTIEEIESITGHPF